MIYLLVILGIFSCSLSQLFLKKSANREHRSKLFEIINPLVIFSYGIFFCSLLINIWAMSHGLELKELAILESLGYVFVPLLSYLVLKETISMRTITAIAVILFGIFVFYL
jgi:drug/metabolite transporter (DMT)-like permease